MYLIIRRNDLLVLVTFVPYLAKEAQRKAFLENRHELVRQLGAEHFTLSIICKEIAEVTDARSWEERDGVFGKNDECEEKEDPAHDVSGVRDLSYQRNKCRLCDRRMKNKITAEASDAFKMLGEPGSLVQMVSKSSHRLCRGLVANIRQFVDINNETLTLNKVKTRIMPSEVAAVLSTSKPSFTFYRHPDNQLLYFIFHSPDSASVQERMKHTMAIPGLINVHAEDQGVHVDQKLEIHDPEDLGFEAKDSRIGKFRSVYLRNTFEGTESRYEGLERDKQFYDGVV